MAAMMKSSGRYFSKNLSSYLSGRYFISSIKNQQQRLSHSSRACISGQCHATATLQYSRTWREIDWKLQVVSSRAFHTSLVNCESKTIKVPPFADSISEGDVRWEKAVGDSVQVDEVLCEIETDKTAIPVSAPFSGVLEAILIEDGSTVTAGTPLCKLSSDVGGATAPPAVAKPEVVAAPPTPAPPPDTSGSIPATPPVPPSSPPPPGEPMSATPLESLVPKSYQPPTSPLPQVPATPSTGPAPGSQITGTRTEQRVKMNRMRMRIAQRLKEAQNTNAMLTTFNEIDMSNISEMRVNFKDAFFKKHNMKLGFMSAFVKASAYALQDQPAVNAVIDENEIVYRDYIDISVAVATPKGLVVPVIRNVEQMNFARIEKTITSLGEKARAGALAIEDMDGGTFTISNGGVFGSMFGTPIINPPQSAILGMHGIFQRPVAINGKVEIRPMMYVALTYDHRLIDGREAVLFLRKIKECVEDPRVVLLDI